VQAASGLGGQAFSEFAKYSRKRLLQLSKEWIRQGLQTVRCFSLMGSADMVCLTSA
jgi:hypothetical protein